MVRPFNHVLRLFFGLSKAAVCHHHGSPAQGRQIFFLKKNTDVWHPVVVGSETVTVNR